ncbi:hypothetical protein ISN44_As13g012050 [Arabidopsis suecica]|uniref:Transposase Tnp1/En/Spm-like domain-containing protein n=1 Tax=Arabidopsis suecica TaxID=45249 RepID=A0A8T1XT61_ARASU|nr:hypothetical protein ISN44_As13g012050 [Arabidopsis suecica]
MAAAYSWAGLDFSFRAFWTNSVETRKRSRNTDRLSRSPEARVTKTLACVSGEQVAIGRVCSTDPEDKVHLCPLGPNASKIWVEVSKIDGARVWRPNSEIQVISDAVGNWVAWPNKHIVFIVFQTLLIPDIPVVVISEMGRSKRRACQALGFSVRPLLFPITMSSGVSFGSVSDCMRARTPDDSATLSYDADRFLAESLDDESRGDPTSPLSSTADSRAAASELRRRESSSQGDTIGTSLIRTEVVIPRLIDEDVGEVKPDELDLIDEPEPIHYGVAGPAPYVLDYFGPTRNINTV